MARTPRRWPVVNAAGRVLRRFDTRAQARSYARAHKLRQTAEYRARVAPKLAQGISLGVARGHPPGGARKTPKRKTRGGAVVRPQWTIGLAGLEGRSVTVREALRRLRAFRRDNPDLPIVGVALHGKPYKDRRGVTRWTGWLQTADDLEQRLAEAQADGITDLADVSGLADRAAWESIDELTFYRPEGASG